MTRTRKLTLWGPWYLPCPRSLCSICPCCPWVGAGRSLCIYPCYLSFPSLFQPLFFNQRRTRVTFAPNAGNRCEQLVPVGRRHDCLYCFKWKSKVLDAHSLSCGERQPLDSWKTNMRARPIAHHRTNIYSPKGSMAAFVHEKQHGARLP